MSTEPVRALWLINHSAAMRSDARMLLSAGVTGVFLPKRQPSAIGFRSGAVTEEFDASLGLAPEELSALNAADWHGEVPDDVWDLVNRRFAILAFRPGSTVAFQQATRCFGGTVVLRAFGVGNGQSYTGVLQEMTGGRAIAAIEALGDRFVFGQAYEGLADLEHAVLADRRALLPLSLPACHGPSVDDRRGDARMLFVCPDIQVHARYREAYEQFLRHFRDVPHSIAGRQPVAVRDPNVLGWLPRPEFDGLMHRCSVMFYESRDPRHLHYHPLEAMRAGAPVVYLSGGLLERLAGRDRAGCAKSWEAAKQLVQRLVRGDHRLADAIVAAQRGIVAQFDESATAPRWRQAMAGAMMSERSREPAARMQACEAGRRHRRRPLKVAVFLPEAYLGGTLRATRQIAAAIVRAGSEAGRDVRVVLAPLDRPGFYGPDTWNGLGPGVEVRPARWSHCRPEAVAAMASLLRRDWNPEGGWRLPIDGHDNYLDCDAWIVVSDRVAGPVLNIRPVAMVVFDCLQRYVAGIEDRPAWHLARIRADRIAVTTEATKLDLVQLGSIPGSRIVVLPPLLPESCMFAPRVATRPAKPYFLWGTNLGAHKNHSVAIRALELYYSQHAGCLRCIVTGVGSERVGMPDSPEGAEFRAAHARTPALRRKVRFAGYVDDARLRTLTSRAEFAWNPSIVDNGTYNLLEAACRGVPCASSDYPAMRELASWIGLRPTWFDSWDPADMAACLATMERTSRDDVGVAVDPRKVDFLQSTAAMRPYWQLVEDLT